MIECYHTHKLLASSLALPWAQQHHFWAVITLLFRCQYHLHHVQYFLIEPVVYLYAAYGHYPNIPSPWRSLRNQRKNSRIAGPQIFQISNIDRELDTLTRSMHHWSVHPSQMAGSRIELLGTAEVASREMDRGIGESGMQRRVDWVLAAV
jgi:hypothetical protein